MKLLGSIVTGLALAAATAPAGALAARIVVRVQPGAAAHERALERRLGAHVVGETRALGLRELSVPRSELTTTLAALRGDDSVATAEPTHLVHADSVMPNDPFLAYEWSLQKTNAATAWATTTGSSQVIVAVVDTGVDASQPDLQGRLVAGYDVIHGSSTVVDDNGHGTAVAGIIGANTNNGLGVASYCWRCSIMPVKVLRADGVGTDADVATGIVWATDHGARVINLSLAGPDPSAALASAVDYARLHNVLVVAAAGNDGSTAPSYPAAAPNVLSVGASDPGDQLYPWSNSGSWVAVAAPGENTTTGRGGDYVSFSGTSSATPVVAGIAGLAFSAAPTATSAAVITALEQSATSVPGVTFGRVDAGRTLAALSVATPVPRVQSAPTTKKPPAKKKRHHHPHRRLKHKRRR